MIWRKKQGKGIRNSGNVAVIFEWCVREGIIEKIAVSKGGRGDGGAHHWKKCVSAKLRSIRGDMCVHTVDLLCCTAELIQHCKTTIL